MDGYYLCSKLVIKTMNPTEVSNSFSSGYVGDNEEYFVAMLDFEETEKVFRKMILENTDNRIIDFWCRECVGGTMDVSTITISGCKKGLLLEIENKIGLTSERNIAMTIKNLSERFYCTPIEFINKISKPKRK